VATAFVCDDDDGGGGDYCEQDSPCEVDKDAYTSCVGTSAE